MQVHFPLRCLHLSIFHAQGLLRLGEAGVE